MTNMSVSYYCMPSDDCDDNRELTINYCEAIDNNDILHLQGV